MGTVVNLPTAAPRKVQQRYNRHLREFRAANPWPGERIDPSRRAMEEWFQGVERTPELLMVLAVLRALEPEQRRAAQNIVHGVAFHFDDEASRAASALVAGIK